MKTLATLATVLPGAALAHGAHAPVPEASHSFVHMIPALFVIALAAILWTLWSQRQ